MLLDDTKRLFDKYDDFDVKKLRKKIGEKLNLIIQKERFAQENFEDYFGKNPAKNYMTPEVLEHNLSILKETKINEKAVDIIHKKFNTEALNYALCLACYRGCLPAVKYFLEELKLPYNIESDESFFAYFHEELEKKEHDRFKKSRPFCLAVYSGNVQLVDYIYKNTNVLVEENFGTLIEKSPLMIACGQGDFEMANHLIKRSNPNGNMGAFGTYPLNEAMKAQSTECIQLLISHGAVVTNENVIRAIELGLEIEIILSLIHACIQKENPRNSYIFAAIRSGSIELTKLFESVPFILPVIKLVKFDRLPLEKRLIKAALESGNPDMLQYIAESKKLDIKKWVSEDFQERNEWLTAGKEKKDRKMADDHIKSQSILYSALAGSRRSQNIKLLKYLIEDLQCIPTNQVLEEACSNGGYWKAIAYLYSFMPEHLDEREFLLKIAHDFESQDLSFLFKIYNTSFVQSGNIYEKYRPRNYVDFVSGRIQEKLQHLSVYEKFYLPYLQDEEVRIGALFYYCSSRYKDRLDKFFEVYRWRTQYKEINYTDTRNILGNSLLLQAVLEHNNNLAKQLIFFDANPDLPNHEGETALFRLLDSYYDEQKALGRMCLEQAPSVCNTLRYVSKRSFGVREILKSILLFTKGELSGITVREMTVNLAKKREYNTIVNLFTLLNKKHAKELLLLIHDEEFCAANNISNFYRKQIIKEFRSTPSNFLSKDNIESLFVKVRSLDEVKKNNVQEQFEVLNKIIDDYASRTPEVIHGLFASKKSRSSFREIASIQEAMRTGKQSYSEGLDAIINIMGPQHPISTQAHQCKYTAACYGIPPFL